MWSRRQFLAAAALAQGRSRPNVLVFMSDQESALLPGPAELPNRRKLERGGAIFTSAVCNTPQCSAARSSLLTGLPPLKTGVRTNVDTGSLGNGLKPEMPNVGSVFARAGYTTGYFGKWHLGGDRNGLDRFGFGAYEPGKGDDNIAQRAADWIRKQRSPWLAWVSVLNPHHIYEVRRELERVRVRPGVRPPSSGLENLKGKPAEQQEYVDKDQGAITRDFTREDWLKYRSFYLGLVEKADANLGTVLSAIPDLDATVAVYTTDHGDALGEHGLPFKGPFMYEELLRIPLVIRGGGLQGKHGGLVTQCDLAPTLAALAGIEWPSAIDGKSLLQPVRRDAVVLEYYAKQKWVNPIRTARAARWKLNAYERGNRELYDLESDPHELRNLAGAAPEVQRRLEKLV